ncbi:MAG: NADH-quinone oxidoreductase subunit NuoF [Candidatus Dormibacteria bacterium]
MAELRVLTEHLRDPEYRTMNGYLARGGYQSLRRAIREMQPQDVTEEVKKSGLRGRGGAGFPTGMKWSFLPRERTSAYLVVNADEGEPGTFKDRELLEDAPHLLIEGVLLTCYAIGARHAFIYVRAEYDLAFERLSSALTETYRAGLAGDSVDGTAFACDIVLHPGAGAYICGEESALLESLEGRRGQPRSRPPFPAVSGLYRKPTVVNNVETICNIPMITGRGGDWYASMGTEKSKGTRMMCVSGHVVRPGNYEVEMGTTFRELIFDIAGGVPGGRSLKAFVPGGSSTPMLTPDHLDVGCDFEAVQAAGSIAGSGGLIVMDDTTCMVKVAARLAYFYAHESCGKCTPCREGTLWQFQALTRIEDGLGRPHDIALLESIGRNISGKVLCALGDGAAAPTLSAIQYFREEFEEHVRLGRCPRTPQPAMVGA